MHNLCSYSYPYQLSSIIGELRLMRLVMVSVMVSATMRLLTFVSTTVMAKAGYSCAGLYRAKCIDPGVSCLVFYAYVKLIPDRFVLVVEPKFDRV